MSPGKSCDINGPRPSPLLIHKDSRLIRKPSQSQQPQLRQPLIIYTHSPKVIHTQPKDFMALVQRLTGFTPPHPQPPHHYQTVAFELDHTIINNNNNIVNDLNDSSSGLTEEERDHRSQRAVQEVQSNSFFADLPLFTPPSSSLLPYSSHPHTSPLSSPGFSNSLSPSFLQFLKALPEF